jgi:hypothetical protein
MHKLSGESERNHESARRAFAIFTAAVQIRLVRNRLELIGNGEIDSVRAPRDASESSTLTPAPVHRDAPPFRCGLPLRLLRSFSVLAEFFCRKGNLFQGKHRCNDSPDSERMARQM